MRRGLKLRLGGVAILLLTLAVVVAEVVVGNAIHHRIATAVAKRTGVDVDVDLGSRPALLDLAEGEIPVLNLSTGAVCGVEGVSADASLAGVATSAPVSFEESSVSLAISLATVEELLARSPKGKTIERVGGRLAADPADGEVVLEAGPGGVVQIPLRPTLRGDTLSLSPGTATLMGRPLPAGVTERLGGVEPQSRDLSHLPLGLRPTAVRVTSEGVALDLHGGAQTLDASAHLEARGVCQKITGKQS